MLEQRNPSAVAPVTAELPAGRWVLDPAASRLAFAIEQSWGLAAITGEFPAMTGELEITAQSVSGQLMIDAASVATGDRWQDAHLRSNDWLSVDRYPEISFTVAEARRVAQRRLTIGGVLRIIGHTTHIRLTADMHVIESDLMLSTTCTVDRRTIGLRWGVPAMTSNDLALSASVRLERGE